VKKREGEKGRGKPTSLATRGEREKKGKAVVRLPLYFLVPTTRKRGKGRSVITCVLPKKKGEEGGCGPSPLLFILGRGGGRKKGGLDRNWGKERGGKIEVLRSHHSTQIRKEGKGGGKGEKFRSSFTSKAYEEKE